MSQWCAYPALPVPIPESMLVSIDSDCAYLPGRRTTYRCFRSSRVPPEFYHDLMDRGFRRSRDMFYQPACRGCRACVQIRLRAADFLPSRSHRRCMKRNSDLDIRVAKPQATGEKFELYQRYQKQRHGDSISLNDYADFEGFLYASPVDTYEFEYRDQAGRLLAVGICDVCSLSLSSVYFYYDPEEKRRGLGTYGVLKEIEYARQKAIEFYYLGFWVSGCAAMEYKRDFKPHELLGPDGVWRAGDDD